MREFNFRDRINKTDERNYKTMNSKLCNAAGTEKLSWRPLRNNSNVLVERKINFSEINDSCNEEKPRKYL